MVRKFWLVNGNESKYELTSKKNNTFAANPTGLGFSNTLTFQRVGDENMLSYEQTDFIQMGFELIFYQNNPSQIYKEYRNFVKFLSYAPLYVYYSTPNDSSTFFRRKVKVSSLSKSEINHEDGALHCDFTLAPMDFWEDGTSKVIDTSLFEHTTEKKYPLERPYGYGATDLSNIQIICAGMLDTPIAFTIEGEVTDPIVKLYDEDGKQYGACKLLGTYDYIYVNSDTSDEQIILKQNGTIVANAYSFQDLTVGSPNEIYVTFLKLKAGINRLAFELSNPSANVKIEWRDRYATV